MALSLKQKLAIESILAGDKQIQTAERAGVTTRTIQNWLKNPEFRTELWELREDRFNAALNQLVDAMRVSIDTLKRSAGGDDSVSADSIRSANYLLSHAKSYLEMGHYSEQLRAVMSELERLRMGYEIKPNNYLEIESGG